MDSPQPAPSESGPSIWPDDRPRLAGRLLKLARHDWPVWLVAFTVFANGSLDVIAALLANHPKMHRVGVALPFGISTWNRSATIVLGFTLVFFSFHLLRRRKLAWWLGVSTLMLVAGLHVFWSRHPYLSSSALVVIILLLLTRHRFTVRFEPRGSLRGLWLMAITLAIALIWGTVAFYLLDSRDFGREFGFGEAMLRTLRQFVLVGNADLLPRSRSAHAFLIVLSVLGVTAEALALTSLFRPIVYRTTTLPRERRRARGLVLEHGRSPYDYFKAWPDKSLFFPTSGSFVGYRVHHGVAVSLGDPVTPPGELEESVKGFIRFARDNGWAAAFLMPEDLPVYRQLNLWFIKIGEEASVNLEHFLGVTAKNKYFRYIRRAMEQRGVTFTRSIPPHPHALIDELEKLSTEWIGQTRYREFGFVQGTFSREYLAETILDVLRDQEGNAIAYINETPSFRPGERNFDMMRRLPGSHWATMDYLFLRTMEALHGEGYRSLNLGLAPFRGVGSDPGATLLERTMRRVTAYTQRLARTQGLSEYKKKFEPEWESRYVIYEGGPLFLPQVALALTTIP